MHLVSTDEQTATIAEKTEVQFEPGESIRTECSYKYSLEEFAALASEAGFEVVRVWTDPKKLFSVQYLKVRT